MMPTVEALSAGTAMKRTSISSTGATAIFQFFEMNTTPSAPKSAGRIWAKAGASAGESSSGVSGVMSSTPRMMIKVVTMLDTAIAIVEMISPSSELMLTSACSSALSATGSLRLEMLPVTKERYEPPAPSIGT